MAFTKFTQLGKKESSFISVTDSKSFGFGGDFLSQYGLKDKKFVELFFDVVGDEKKIAFKFVDEKNDNNAFKLIVSKVSNSKSVVARSFFTTLYRNNGVNLNEYVNRYKPNMEHNSELGTLYIVKLKKRGNNEASEKNISV